MTHQELIERLQKYPEHILNKPVLIRGWNEKREYTESPAVIYEDIATGTICVGLYLEQE